MTPKNPFDTIELKKEILREVFVNFTEKERRSRDGQNLVLLVKETIRKVNQYLKAEVEKIINGFINNIEVIGEDNQRRLMISKVELLIKLKDLKSKLGLTK